MTRGPASIQLRHWLAMAALAALAAFAFQGTRGIYDSTEGRYALVAMEMHDRGAWIEPTLEGEPHWTKPPPTYWAIAGGVSLLGRNAWGARLHLAIASLLSSLAVAGIGASLWDRRTGLCAGLVHGTAPFVVSGANTLSTDTLLSLFEILAVLAYALFLRSGWRGWLAGMWLAFGAGFGVKGPVALLPIVAIAIWHRRARKGTSLVHGPGMILGAVAAFWWFAVVVARHPELLGYFIGTELVARVASDEFHRNAAWYMAFAIYVPAIVGGAGPWVAYAWAPVVRERLWQPRRAWALLSSRTPAGLLLLWIATSFVILSLSRSRLPLYTLPLMAPVALLLGRAVAKTATPWGSLRRVSIVAAAMAAVAVAGKGLAALSEPPRNMGRLWALVVEVGVAGDGVRLVAVDRERLHGLRFYYGGPLTLYFAGIPAEPIAPERAASEVERMFREWPDAQRIVFIDRKWDGFARWCAALGEGPTPVRSAESSSWVVCSVERAASAGP